MIYKGQFVDDQGVPFCPGIKVLWARDPTCGVACAKKGGLVAHKVKMKFIGVQRTLANRWWKELSQGERDYWKNDGLLGVTARGDLDRYPCNGFLMWSAAQFAAQFHQLPADPGWMSGWPDQTWLTAGIDVIDPGGDQVTFHVTYTDHMHDCPFNHLVVFQVSPKKVLGNVPHRATRILHMATMTQAVPPYYKATVNLAWNINIGHILRLYFRGRSLFHYCYHAMVSQKA